MQTHFMKKIAIIILLLYGVAVKAKETKEIDSTQMLMDAINEQIEFKQSGSVDLGKCTLIIPEGFKFLDSSQSRYVLEDLWGNPPSEVNTLGMLFPKELTPASPDVWAYEISFDEMGYVKDKDAEKIDYDDLLKDLQKDEDEINKERVKLGYSEAHIIGWASKPYYDHQNKVLHWAKELHFGTDSLNTLNYNIRFLARKGVLVVNAIAGMDKLNEVKAEIPEILKSVKFNSGEKYSDFNPDLDKIAAYGIGGLVAGKVLAKAGLFAVLLKYIKVIIIAVVAFFGKIYRSFFGKKEDEKNTTATPNN